jgi:hypothetical protein
MPIDVRRTGSYPVVLQGVLDRIQQAVKVIIDDWEDKEEWFLIESNYLEDSALYNQVRLQWNQIVSIHYERFALLHCQGGPDAGVWVHFFDEGPEEFAPGCHLLPSW